MCFAQATGVYDDFIEKMDIFQKMLNAWANKKLFFVLRRFLIKLIFIFVLKNNKKTSVSTWVYGF